MSNCACVYIGDYDGPEAFTCTARKARKEHKCYECGKTIRKGEIYEESTGIWDGTPDRYRTCSDCVSVREEFFCEGYTYGYIWNDLCAHLRDLNGTFPCECIARLTPTAREKVCDLIERIWRDRDE